MLGKLKYLCLVMLCGLLFLACKKEENESPSAEVFFDDKPFELSYGTLPIPDLPADNPLTKQGVHLGKMLFYEKMLSKDLSQACADCHRQADGFSDSTRLSIGVEGLPGKRQAMPIFNLAWHSNAFFWDGRAPLLRDQALKPIQDPLEMNETLENVIAKLNASKTYTDQFIRAFGSDEITPEKIALALEQFMLSIVSYNSRYDKYLALEVNFTPSEERGRQLFFSEFNPSNPDISGPNCVVCHSGDTYENDQYMNNGMDTDAEFIDLGREEVTGNPEDRAKFKVPTLRNIAVTAPYMHDGRFETLEQVLDHYNEGIKESSTVDLNILNTASTGLFLTEQDKVDLVNFLNALTDEIFLASEEYENPF